MAQDIEARSTGNSAMVIGLIAVVLAVAIGAFLFMRPSGDSTTIVDRTVPAGNTTIVNPPAEINVSPSTSTGSSPNVSNADSGSSSSTSVTSSTTTSDPASGSSTTSSTTTTSNQ